MIGSSQGITLKHKIGEKTSHSYWSWTMVQGGLVTAHHGGDHGDGEASGGQSSLQQSVETGSSGDREIRIVVVVEQ